MNMITRFGGHRSLGHSARLDAAPLTDDELYRLCPSVFAETPHESRSERYAYIPTIEVIRGLRAEGFDVYSGQQGRSRIPGKADYTKHLLRMRKVDNPTIVNGTVHELLLLNSHDGTSAYRMMEGFFRFICTNGLVTGDIQSDIRIPHSGKQAERVIEAAYTVLERAEVGAAAIDAWSGLTLDAEQVDRFGRAARAIRYPELREVSRTEADARLDPAAVTRARRSEDARNDLWSLFNRAQENLIRGGFDVRTPIDPEPGKRHRVNRVLGPVRVRAAGSVNAIDQSTAINRNLWTLAQAQAELLAA